MKTHTNKFKEAIARFGREIDSVITYEENNTQHTLTSEDLNAVTPIYKGSILKSVMKQLDIESTVDIPLQTIVNYKFGVKVDGTYEYLDYGNYVVYKSEKQEDTNSYKITCYDKMLYAMVNYENMNITYPITIRNYLNAICTHLGLTFANVDDTFANYDKEIANELYLDSDGNSLGYTFRDVLDELAQVTASIICLNKNDELEIRYVSHNSVVDTINEEYLKDINVTFGEKFGPINSLILSRSADADVTDPVDDPQSIAENGLCQIKISNNQIMNWQDRENYMQDIFDKLNGLEYYLNDFTSPGIAYYDLGDRYNVEIGEKTYSCLMLNNELDVTQGLQENIYTDVLEEINDKYPKTGKTDKKVNQIYLIVDKQNGVIQSLIDKTVYVSDTKSGIGSIALENAYAGQLYKLSIKGTISLLFPQNEEDLYGFPLIPNNQLTPSNNLTPSSPIPYQNEIHFPNENLFPKSNVLLIDETEYVLDFGFLNYINNDICDEFVYENGICFIIRRVGINSQGNMYELDNEVIEPRKNTILNVKNDSIIKLKSFSDATLTATYLLDNEYTSNFATKVDVSSEIKQTADSINLEVASKVDEKDYTGANIMLKINQDESEAQINADKISLAGKQIDLTADDVTIDSTNLKITPQGDINMISNHTNSKLTLTGQAYGGVQAVNKIVADGLRITADNKESVSLQIIKSEEYSGGTLVATGYSGYLRLRTSLDNSYSEMSNDGFATGVGGTPNAYMYSDGEVHASSYTGGSLESIKKNIELYSENAIEIIKKSDIYTYNLKTEKDYDKKHIGLVIGDQNKTYNTPDVIVSKNGDGIDIYSMISVAWKAIQEQQEIIEKLQEKIEKLESESE